ncbi:1-acylglycerol-3-phosphate O-acyltransferase [Altererythrobacter insulae]|nr:1-acylglycerol-3-phosphate O-acyltransferase [Altererythrobacter insulae]
MSILRSLVYYPVFYGWSAMLVIASVIALFLGQDQLRSVVRSWAVWHRWCLENIIGITVRVEGELSDQPALYAIKHESFFEAIDMPVLLDCPSVFAKRELFMIPGWGRSAVVYGLIPVARNEGARTLRQMIVKAKEKLAEGRPLVLFPEGTRVKHGKQPELQSGFAGLYKLLGLQVIPIAVNSGPLYHRIWKRAGTITYKVGEPIPAGLPRAEAEARVHAAINALNEEI